MNCYLLFMLALCTERIKKDLLPWFITNLLCGKNIYILNFCIDTVTWLLSPCFKSYSFRSWFIATCICEQSSNNKISALVWKQFEVFKLTPWFSNMSLTGWCQFRVNRNMSEIICLGCLMPGWHRLMLLNTRHQHSGKFKICHRAQSAPPPPVQTPSVAAVWEFDEYPENENRKKEQIYFNFSFVIILINLNSVGS